MNDLIKIRDVSIKYDISARSLRYYEDMGLIKSTRSDDYAYRLYDDANLQRLEQIMILRKLNTSIKDIQRIFYTSGSEVVLEVLGKKVDTIDKEVSLLRELREIVLEFIRQIEQADFGKESDVKLLYEKAKEIESQLVNVGYEGNPSMVNRLFEVTEKLDNKVPDILTGQDDKVEWFWRIKDEITDDEVKPYKITEFEGSLYAVAVSVDGDGESHNRVRDKTAKWLEGTNFTIDNDRRLMGHMIYVDDEIREGLGYHQMNLYAPIKLKNNF